MKTKRILNIALGASIAFGFTACDENDWNDDLKGFQGGQNNDQVETVAYTLTPENYAWFGENVKSIASDDAETAVLTAISANKCFATAEDAAKYLPYLLSDSSFPYFSLSSGSAIKLTYDVAGSLPAEVTAVNTTMETTTITEDQYKELWGSSKRFVESFTPEKSPSKYIPGFLSDIYEEPAEGQLVMVTYNYADYEPDFDARAEAPRRADSRLTSVIGSMKVGDNVTVTGVVTGICNRGFILTDNSGSVLCYQASGFNTTDVAIGDIVKVTQEVSAYNKGLQLSIETGSYDKAGTMGYTYPEPVAVDGAAMDAAILRTDDAPAQYVRFTGTLKLSGNYVNIEVPGATAATGSGYQVPSSLTENLESGLQYIFTGYFCSISQSGGAPKYYNVLITGIEEAPAPAYTIESERRNDLYRFAGEKWVPASDFIVIQPSEYAVMGQKYENLSNPDYYLPIYLAQTLPFAAEGDSRNVMFKYYAGGNTTWHCTRYTYTSGTWVSEKGTVTEQYVRRNGEWLYDPSVVITLPAGKGVAISTKYYQACVDWVFNNICKPLGDTNIKSGLYYVTSYGNNEYYSGTSAYQGNLDLRAAKAREQYPEGWEGYTDEEIPAVMMTRFCKEVMPAVLGTLNPDAKPVDGVDVTYTINFAVYTGSSANYTAVFRVTAPGTFEYVSCDWYSINNVEEK